MVQSNTPSESPTQDGTESQVQARNVNARAMPELDESDRDHIMTKHGKHEEAACDRRERTTQGYDIPAGRGAL